MKYRISDDTVTFTTDSIRAYNLLVSMGADVVADVLDNQMFRPEISRGKVVSYKGLRTTMTVYQCSLPRAMLNPVLAALSEIGLNPEPSRGK